MSDNLKSAVDKFLESWCNEVLTSGPDKGRTKLEVLVRRQAEMAAGFLKPDRTVLQAADSILLRLAGSGELAKERKAEAREGAARVFNLASTHGTTLVKAPDGRWDETPDIALSELKVVDRDVYDQAAAPEELQPGKVKVFDHAGREIDRQGNPLPGLPDAEASEPDPESQEPAPEPESQEPKLSLHEQELRRVAAQRERMRQGRRYL